MGVTIANGDIVETVVHCHDVNQSGLNVRHWVASAVSSVPPEYLELAVKISTDIAPLYKAVLAVEANYDGVSVRRISPLPVTAVVSDGTGFGTGSVTGGACSPQVAGLVTLRTQFGGSRYRGRMYVPFPGLNDTTAGGRPNNNLLDKYGAIANYFGQVKNLVMTTHSVSLTPLVWSRKYNTYSVITTAAPRAFFATQRRRSFAGPGDFLG